MKAYRITVSREVLEFVDLIVPAGSAQEALNHIETIGVEQAVEDYAQKDIDGDYPAWEFGDYSGDPQIDEYSPNKEIWQCDRCGEIRELEEVQHHRDVCHMFASANES